MSNPADGQQPSEGPYTPSMQTRMMSCGRDGCRGTSPLAWSWFRFRIAGAEAQQPIPLFGNLLRTLRLASGLTQEQLAELAGLSTRGISDLERGARRDPRAATVRKLAMVFELTSAHDVVSDA